MELHSTEYASLTVIKLREELRHRHLKTSGRKVVLVILILFEYYLGRTKEFSACSDLDV